jgi:hypothetical protein
MDDAMWLIRVVSLTGVLIAANLVFAEPQAPAPQPVGLIALLQKNPFGLKDLLGKRAEENIPGYSNWDDSNNIFIADEYRNPEVKYDAYFVLSSYAPEWDFLKGKSCISGYSHAVVIFNNGYLFRIELRFMSSKSYPNHTPVCFDHTPVFELIGRRIGAAEEIASDGGRQIIKLEGDIITILHTKDGSTEFDFVLLGGSGEDLIKQANR